ncbi:hypothetical protein CBOM_07994 [Ceraceosorus bombacis]|uniref:Uncharacterized protein n=1 Tax=Ceraceosorus bombacis TaxID=401625 RepID=A0A0P1BK70_9BASI|nr:hypothetical protein CBOM_07994 [Ceraceosorus bombacis]
MVAQPSSQGRDLAFESPMRVVQKSPGQNWIATRLAINCLMHDPDRRRLTGTALNSDCDDFSLGPPPSPRKVDSF